MTKGIRSSSKKPEKREFVIDCGASMHMLSKKDLSSGELEETLKRSRSPITAVTANGEVQTNEAAQVHVHDLHIFVTVQLLEDTSAVLSLGNLCEEHGYTCEWASGQKPHLAPNEKTILRKTEHFVPVLVLGLSSSSSTSSSSASSPRGSLKGDDKGSAGNHLQDLPEWLEDFEENLEDRDASTRKHFS